MRISAHILFAILLIAPAASAGPQKNLTPYSTAPPALNVSQALDASGQVLLNVIRPGFNPIPLAVLNKARCAVFVNSKGAEDAWGIASCRLTPNKWSAPAFVSFHDDDRAEASRARELLIVVVSDRAARSLRNGHLKLGNGQGSQPGLLVPKHAGIREGQITADTFSYNHAGAATLQPIAIHARLTPDEPMTRGLYSRAVGIPEVLGGHITAPSPAARYAAAQSLPSSTPSRQRALLFTTQPHCRPTIAYRQVSASWMYFTSNAVLLSHASAKSIMSLIITSSYRTAR